MYFQLRQLFISNPLPQIEHFLFEKFSISSHPVSDFPYLKLHLFSYSRFHVLQLWQFWMLTEGLVFFKLFIGIKGITRKLQPTPL